MTTIKPVPTDPELIPLLTQFAPADAPDLTREALPGIRKDSWDNWPSVEQMLDGRPIEYEDVSVPGPAGAPDVTITILRPKGHAEAVKAGKAKAPGFLNIHGGGMMIGHRLMDVPRLAEMVMEFGAVTATVEYRLAPEHPHPAPVEDCHAALVWFADNAAALGVDPDKIIVMGGSAGGGLSAGVSLLARDRKSVKLAGQLLLCPMIDDRNTSVSSHQYLAANTWTRPANLLGWDCLLGADAGTDSASPYAAPLRAPDVSNLPPAYIEVGSAEMFRVENTEYAERIWSVGGECELHVWSGGFHGFDMYAPGTAISRAALAARFSWVRRVLGL